MRGKYITAATAVVLLCPAVAANDAIAVCCTGTACAVAGGYGHAQDTYASGHRLALSGTRNGSGSLTLSAAGKTYTLTRDRIVNVTWPPGVTP